MTKQVIRSVLYISEIQNIAIESVLAEDYVIQTASFWVYKLLRFYNTFYSNNASYFLGIGIIVPLAINVYTQIVPNSVTTIITVLQIAASVVAPFVLT